MLLRFYFFDFIESLSTNLSSRYSTDGSITVIVTTEHIVPIPIRSPTVEIEFWLEIKWITKRFLD